MIRKIRRLLTVLLILALFSISFIVYGIYVSVERLNINYETITSSKIPTDLNNLSIAFISDIHYNGFMNQKRLEPMIQKINEANPDIIIFGGDLFDHTLENTPSSEVQTELLQQLKSLDAPLGKFAVLGEEDQSGELIKELTTNLLYQADFELLENRSIRIRNESNASITIIGIDSMIGGQPNIEQAFANVNRNELNIVVTHCPDLITSIPTNSVDLMFAGHSHGGQIRLPLFGPISTIEGAKTYNHGTETVGTTLLHVSNGIGTTNYDMRLFAPPEILFYRFVAKKAK